ncbi:hypothetical protein ABK040_000221 [Willaertia magna]
MFQSFQQQQHANNNNNKDNNKNNYNENNKDNKNTYFESLQDEEYLSDYLYSIRHVFWLRKLPQQEEEENNFLLREMFEFLNTNLNTTNNLHNLNTNLNTTIVNNNSLNNNSSKNNNNLNNILPINKEDYLELFEIFKNWTELQGNSTVNNINSDTLFLLLKQLNISSSLPLFIKGSNAGLIISKRQENSLQNSLQNNLENNLQCYFEIAAFKVHQPNTIVTTSSNGALCGVFPEIIIKVTNEELIKNLSFCQQLQILCNNNNFEEVMEITKKRGINVSETREPINPKYITEWLLSTLTNRDGIINFINEKRIIKKIRDCVLWNDVEIPFRRSGLWLTMKVVIETFFIWKFEKFLGKIYYKMFILKFMLALTDKINNNNLIDTEIKYQIICKIANRMKKLEILVNDYCKEICKENCNEKCKELNYFIQLLFEQGLTVITNIKKLMEDNWDKIIKQNEKNNSFILNFENLNLKNFTKQTLPNADKYLKQLINESQQQQTTLIYNNNTNATDNLTITNTVQKRKILLPKCIERSNNNFVDIFFNFDATLENDKFTQLFDFENWVRDEMDNWLSITNANFSKDLDIISIYSEKLFNFLTNYEENAKIFYKNDPLGNSRMILTILNIIRALHILAIKISPILKEYKSGVDIKILQSVLAVTKCDLEYIKFLENYFLNFDKCAHYDSMLQQCDNVPNNTSFFVRFAKQDSNIQNKKREILEMAEIKKKQKIKEIKEKRNRYNQLRDKSNELEHEYYTPHHNPYREYHSRYCSKCRYMNEANNIKVLRYEWPLPYNENESNTVMFELCAPNPLFHYRDAIHLLATIDGRVVTNNKDSSGDSDDSDNSRSSIKGLWRNTEQLSGHCTSKAKRITLASESKSFSVSHYNCVKDLIEREAVVPNGFQLCYANIYNVQKRIRLEAKADIKDLTYFELQQDIYKSLDWSVKSLNHDQNQVLAKKSECHIKLAMTEFIEFGSFRAGHHLLIHNLIRCIETHSLSFDREDVLRLILQSLWEAGPSSSSNSWIRESNVSLCDKLLVNELLNLLTRLLDEYQDNWKAIPVILLVISTCSRILTINVEDRHEKEDIISNAVSLILRCRDITSKWAIKIETILSEMSNAPPKQIDEIRFKLIETAACSCLTYFVDEEYYNTSNNNNILGDSSSLTFWLKSVARIHDNLLLNKRGIKNLTNLQKFLLRRVYFTSLTIEKYIYRGIEKFTNIPLNEFVKQHWNDFKNGSVVGNNWKRNDRWFCAEFKTKDNLIILHLDSLRGALLINGSPIGRLPESITNHQDYNRIFGNHVFEVQPGSSDNTFVTVHKSHGSIFRFSLNTAEDNISIVEIRDGVEYTLFSHSHFVNHNNQDLPSILIDNYSHWFDSSNNTILFRPISFIDSSFTKDIFYQFDLTTREIKEMSSNRYLIDINSNIFKEIYLKILKRLELKNYIHMFINNDNKITIDLPLKNLHFTLENNNLKSIEYGMKVSNQWNIKTLIGINNGIILVDEDPQSTRQLLLMPFGKVKIVENSSGLNNHQTVKIDMNSDHSFIAYNINNRLKRLEGNENLISWLFLCLLHATTSSVLPDPFNNLTGMESAINLLHSARLWSSIPFTKDILGILHDIYNLSPCRNYYPEHLQNMERVSWPQNIPSIVAHDAYCILVDRIIQDNQKFIFAHQQQQQKPFNGETNLNLNRKEYWRCISYYCNEAKISQKFEKKPQITKIFSDTYEWHNEKIKSVRLLTGDLMNNEFNDISNVKNTLENFIWTHKRETIKGVSKEEITNWNSIEDWRSIEPITNFLSLFEFARTAVPKGRKYCFIFLLSFLMYKYPHQSDILEIFKVVMINYNYFKDIIIPNYVEFTELTENNFDEFSLNSVLRKNCKDFSNSMTSKKRIELLDTQSNDITKAVSTLKAQWDLGLRNYTSHYSDYIFNSDAYSEILKLMNTWRQNKDFKIFIYGLISSLSLVPNNKHSNYTLTPSVISNKEFSFTQIEQIYQSALLMKHTKRFDLTEASSIFSSGNLMVESELNNNENHDNTLPPITSTQQQLPQNSINNQFFSTEENACYCKIYDSYMSDLKKSCEIYELTSTTNQCIVNNEELEKKRSYLKQKLCDLWKILESIFLPSNEEKEIVSQALHVAGLWPRASLITLLPSLCKEEDAQQQYPKQFIDLLGAIAVLLTLDQRIERCQTLKTTNHSTYLKELENKGYENWSPKKHPEWLLLQLEMNVMIRPRQVEVANHMLNTSENMVMQFNMGEGKTSVVIPMLALALSQNKSQLVRLTVLKSLFKINYSSLVFKLGGLLNRRVITIPFNRQIKFSLSDIKELKKTYEQCMKEKGILLTVPEHRLSFKLKGLEIKNDENLTLSLIELQDWLNNNVRDILDESDEILHVRYQLVYTIGSQFPIRGDSLRWTIPQEIFKLIKKHIEKFFTIYGPTKIEYIADHKMPHAFPHIRLLDKEIFFKISEIIVRDSIMDGDNNNLGIPLLTGEKKEAVMKFIVNEEIDKQDLEVIHSMFKDSPILNELFILRGLFAYGVLYLALNRRWRVNYGVKQGGERLIAVPFRAKDVAAERAEFGHPDVAILLTQLSYYYYGLSTDQLDTVFTKLETLESPEHEYNKWIREIPEEIVPITIRNYRAVNLSDYNQKMNVLYPLMERNMTVVDFYLSNVVFPKECKQFKEKLTSSSWDLCEKTKFPVSGFSGTKSCLLPLSIKANELRQLMGTSGEVLVKLFKEENNDYHVIKNGESCIEILRRITGCVPSQRVLLDVGALMLELPNREIAKEWLKLLPSTEVSAAIYFDKDDHLFVQDRIGREVPFELSPYKHDLSKCVTYLDEIHTRGTDLKFPRGMKAAVTLGNGVTFERLVQACLRMRMFGNGHSVSFWASQEVDAFLKEKFTMKTPTTNDIVKWAIYNRVKLEKDNTLQWATQGLSHAKKTFAKQLFDTQKLISQNKALQLYLDHCKENEIIELSELYGNPRKLQSVPDICHKQILFIQRSFGIYSFPESLTTHIIEECSKSEIKIFSQILGEEQERELENETEEERVIDRPPHASNARPCLSDALIKFVESGHIDKLIFLPLQASFLNTSHYNSLKNINWNPNLFVTKDFITVIKNSLNNMDNYLRPPTWILCSPTYLIFISPFEANGIVPYCKKFYRNSNVKLHMFSPRLRPNQRMFYNEACFTIPSMFNNSTAHYHIINYCFAELMLYSGSLYFNSMEEQQTYCDLLGICPKPRSEKEELLFESGAIDTFGFVLPEHRASISKSLSEKCIFKQNPLDFARKLIEIHERNSTFNGSHVFDLLMKCKKTIIKDSPYKVIIPPLTTTVIRTLNEATVNAISTIDFIKDDKTGAGVKCEERFNFLLFIPFEEKHQPTNQILTYQSLTKMDVYKDKSFEEWRWLYYSQNLLQNNNSLQKITTVNSKQKTELSGCFEQNWSFETNSFGSLGGFTTSGFGSSQQKTSSGTSFGTLTPNTPSFGKSGFGFTQPTTTTGFGFSSFGGNQSTSLFSTTNTNQSVTATTTGSFGFGDSKNNNGQTNTRTNNPSSTTLFGNGGSNINSQMKAFPSFIAFKERHQPTNQSLTYHSLTKMDIYKDKSFEEWRWLYTLASKGKLKEENPFFVTTKTTPFESCQPKTSSGTSFGTLTSNTPTTTGFTTSFLPNSPFTMNAMLSSTTNTTTTGPTIFGGFIKPVTSTTEFNKNDSEGFGTTTTTTTGGFGTSNTFKTLSTNNNNTKSSSDSFDEPINNNNDISINEFIEDKSYDTLLLNITQLSEELNIIIDKINIKQTLQLLLKMEKNMNIQQLIIYIQKYLKLIKIFDKLNNELSESTNKLEILKNLNENNEEIKNQKKKHVEILMKMKKLEIKLFTLKLNTYNNYKKQLEIYI